jgi:signal transduction histidine kinase
MRDDELMRYLVPTLHKDNRRLSIEFSIQLFRDAGGQIEWVVAVIRDVSARFAREQELRSRLKTTGQEISN